MGEPAAVGPRLGAAVADQVLALAVAAGSVLALGGRWWPLGLVVAVPVVAVPLGRWGTTPGGWVAGVRVADTATGAPLGIGRAVVRSLVVLVAGVPTAGIGAAVLACTALADPGLRRRGWHDRLVGSVVLAARAGPPPHPPSPYGQVNLTRDLLLPERPVLDGVRQGVGRHDHVKGSQPWR